MKTKQIVSGKDICRLKLLERFARTYFTYFDGKWDDVEIVVKKNTIFIFCYRISADDLVSWTIRQIPLATDDINRNLTSFKNKVKYAYAHRHDNEWADRESPGSENRGLSPNEGEPLPGWSLRKVDKISFPIKEQ